jgi:hypothetical protein
MVWVAIQVGNFMNMVIGSKWKRLKRRHLGLVLEIKMLGVEKGRELERVVIGPKNESNSLPFCGKRKRRTKKFILQKYSVKGLFWGVAQSSEGIIVER